MVRGRFPGCRGETPSGRPRRGLSGRKLSSRLAVRGRIASRQAARPTAFGVSSRRGRGGSVPRRPVEIRNAFRMDSAGPFGRSRRGRMATSRASKMPFDVVVTASSATPWLLFAETAGTYSRRKLSSSLALRGWIASRQAARPTAFGVSSRRGVAKVCPKAGRDQKSSFRIDHAGPSVCSLQGQIATSEPPRGLFGAVAMTQRGSVRRLVGYSSHSWLAPIL